MAYTQLPTRTTADTNSAADPNQLQDNIDAILDSEATSGPAVALKDKISTSAIVNDLTTGGTTVPLSAEQGKTLNTNKAADSAVVHNTGDESVAGVKTFSSFPVTPSSAPTTDYQVANKKYVDDSSVNNTWDAISLSDAGGGGVAMSSVTGTYGETVSTGNRYTCTTAGKYLMIIWAESGITILGLVKNGSGFATHNLAAGNDLAITYPVSLSVNDYLTFTWAGSSMGGTLWIVRVGP